MCLADVAECLQQPDDVVAGELIEDVLALLRPRMSPAWRSFCRCCEVFATSHRSSRQSWSHCARLARAIPGIRAAFRSTAPCRRGELLEEFAFGILR